MFSHNLDYFSLKLHRDFHADIARWTIRRQEKEVYPPKDGLFVPMNLANFATVIRNSSLVKQKLLPTVLATVCLQFLSTPAFSAEETMDKMWDGSEATIKTQETVLDRSPSLPEGRSSAVQKSIAKSDEMALASISSKEKKTYRTGGNT